MEGMGDRGVANFDNEEEDSDDDDLPDLCDVSNNQ